MPNYRSRVFLRVLGKDLDDAIVSVSEKKSKPAKVVHTMNKKRVARGLKRANANYTLDIDAEPIDDPTIPDWDVLMDKETAFAIIATPDVGKPTEYNPCYVTDVTDNTSDGDSSKKITVLALDKK